MQQGGCKVEIPPGAQRRIDTVGTGQRVIMTDQVASITPQEIKDIRARLGMTYRQLAMGIGLTRCRALNTVYRWERGLKMPSPASIAALRQLGAAADKGDEASL